MKHSYFFFSLSVFLLVLTSFILIPSNNESTGFSEGNCSTSFGGNVLVNDLYDGGKKIGHSIWLNRSSKRVNAKYFADNPNASLPKQRYDSWRSGKSVVLVSSCAYSSKFTGGFPVGIVIDSGKIVNQKYDSKMDALVIVFATGGIVVSDIEEGLFLDGIGTIDIKNHVDRQKFLRWAKREKASVFQTHLLAYKNQSKIYTKKSSSAVRKFLILAKDSTGSLFHIFFYTKHKSMTLAKGADSTLSYLKGKGMNLIAMVNLETGGSDIIGTGGDAKDCSGNYVTGTTVTRRQMTNMLTYYYE